ncbi:MAG: glycosyltransferase family 2 protein [Desulfovibrionaceae bacterium]|nr:glycosyltransferase family 2 protein [Desulfovibrionaceae bacterium]
MRAALDHAPLRRLLAAVPNWKLGTEGATNQGRLINETLRAVRDGRDELAAPAACLLYWAWQQRPLARELLDGLAGPLGAVLPPETAALCAHLRSTLADEGPADADSTAPGPLSLLAQEFGAALDAGDFDAALALLAPLECAPGAVSGEPTASPSPLAALCARLRAEWALLALPADEAEPLVLAAPAVFGWWRAAALARLTLARGDADRAVALYAELWRAAPWHVNLALTLSTLLRAQGEPASAAPHDADEVCLLLYTWNKAGPLARALDHLRASRTGAARLVVLDNGSTDDTAALLAAERERRGPAMRIERLPVNIGAPAARNWLLSLEEVRRCPWLAFLDDDILLPPDWLERLLGAARAHPGAGAVGCRVVGDRPPGALQAADFHLLAPGTRSRPPFADMAEGLPVADTGLGARETSLFAYARPCLSVTGCCHLVGAAALERAGRFDLRFGPSQFDDLERDLRSALAGMPAFYEGRLAVPHMQHSSLRQATDPARAGHVLGNKIKLEHLYDDAQKAELARIDHEAALTDLDARLAELYARFAPESA